MANRAGTRRKIKNEYYFDYSLIFIVLFLLGFGLMMIYSASSYEAYADYGNEAYYLRKQFIAVLAGLFASPNTLRTVLPLVSLEYSMLTPSPSTSTVVPT